MLNVLLVRFLVPPTMGGNARPQGNAISQEDRDLVNALLHAEITQQQSEDARSELQSELYCANQQLAEGKRIR